VPEHPQIDLLATILFRENNAFLREERRPVFYAGVNGKIG
jgi:hypothetical protein